MQRIALLLAATALLAGCETLQPKVDVAPARPVEYAQAPQAQGVPSGGLFRPATYRPGFEDARARMPGDIVTIQITERVTASQNSSASIDRSADVSAGITAFPFLKGLNDGPDDLIPGVEMMAIRSDRNDKYSQAEVNSVFC